MSTNSASDTPTGASGTVLRGQGVGSRPAYSTATYPATAGTAQNVLTSDGTNFTSAGPQQIIYCCNQALNSPGDGSTYAMTSSGMITTVTFAARYYVIQPCTIKAFSLYINVTGTLGSGETSTVNVRKNGTVDNFILNNVTWTAVDQNFFNLNFSVSLTTGDYFEVLVQNPTWGTNPTNTRLNFTLLVQ